MAQEIVVEQRSADPPAVVWARVVDGAQWPVLSPLGSFELERAAGEDGEGVGAIRVFRSGRITSREEVVEREEERRFAYVLLSGLPIRDYRAQLDLAPDGGGTVLRWRSAFSAKLPGTGRVLERGIGTTIQALVEGLATGRPH